MKISQLQTLLAIRDAGSFSAAALRVHLSHSAVSTQMQMLEAELGAALFVPGRRPARLSAFGRSFCRQAEGVVRGFETLASAREADRTDGEISIGFVPTTLQTLLPVVLGGLAAAFPDLRVRVSSGLSGELAERVAAQTLDTAFVTASEAGNPHLTQIEIAREPLCVIAPPDADRKGSARDWLARLPYIAFAPATRLGAQIQSGLEALGIEPRHAMEIDAIDAIEHLVALGHGCSIVPQRRFAADLGRRLSALPFPGPGPGPDPARRLCLITPRDFPRQRLRQALVDLTRA